MQPAADPYQMKQPTLDYPNNIKSNEASFGGITSDKLSGTRYSELR